jgi:hypothetical protein
MLPCERLWSGLPWSGLPWRGHRDGDSIAKVVSMLSNARPGLPLWDLATRRSEVESQGMERESPGMGQAEG